MGESGVDVSKAFPVCLAKLFRTDEESADWFLVTRVHEGCVSVEALREDIALPLPSEGERVYLQSTGEDAAYRMPVRVVSVEVGGWVALVCRKDGDIERIQRRQKHRLLARKPVRIERVRDPSSEPQDVLTEDMNSQGMRVFAETPMGADEPLALTLSLDDGGPALACRGFVVRCRHAGEGRFEIGIRFEELAKPAADRIVDALVRGMFDL